MKQIPEEIYSKIRRINKDVKENLFRQGIVVPVKNKDGSVTVGRYVIKKLNTGFFCIVDYRNEAVVENINLPQTAAILANKLALGRWIDDKVLSFDSKYGHALFDEELHKKMALSQIRKKNLDQADLMFTKSAIAKSKKEKFKSEIDLGFKKLMNFR